MDGDKVVNEMGEDLGNIKQVMLDLEAGSVAYVVLSSGGSMKPRGKMLGVPFEALRKKPDEHAFILNADKEKLKNAPVFDDNNWPGTHSDDHRQYIKSIHDYYE
ncbi:MAG: PRC-barrel domain-containing protein [Methanolobus sp.]|nr:PRC-barrel domain-containing protein [Methanolobus sp.]